MTLLLRSHKTEIGENMTEFECIEPVGHVRVTLKLVRLNAFYRTIGAQI